MLVANPTLYSAPTSPIDPSQRPKHGFYSPPRTLVDLFSEVRALFEQQQSVDALLDLSRKLQSEFREHLIQSPQCMLPSHDYLLPTGEERGIYLACEVGGSTLRVASVELDGRRDDPDCLRIRHMELSGIDEQVRALGGEAFFDWIADKTKKMLATDRKASNHMENVAPLRMGVAWSFPVEQTSPSNGIILGMGKGFSCSKAVTGRSIGDLINQACSRANLNVTVSAITNDASAAVLSLAYLRPTARLAIILGTGINAAIHLPISALHPSKFGSRTLPSSPKPDHVLVNAELSMYGRTAYKTTRWDDHLNKHHVLPDYQPLEYLIAGGYMGEIVRLVLLEAIDTAGLFRSSIPPSLSKPYCIDTRALATIELDDSPSLSVASKFWTEHFPTMIPISFAEIKFIRDVVLLVSTRSKAYFTAANHALAALLQDMESKHGHEKQGGGQEHEAGCISIGCEGSVVNKYPNYMVDAQALMDKMVALELATKSSEGRKRIVFEGTKDSAVLGAGVAVAMGSAAEAADEP